MKLALLSTLCQILVLRMVDETQGQMGTFPGYMGFGGQAGTLGGQGAVQLPGSLGQQIPNTGIGAYQAAFSPYYQGQAVPIAGNMQGQTVPTAGNMQGLIPLAQPIPIGNFQVQPNAIGTGFQNQALPTTGIMKGQTVPVEQKHATPIEQGTTENQEGGVEDGKKSEGEEMTNVEKTEGDSKDGEKIE